jgi:hypothetical protein
MKEIRYSRQSSELHCVRNRESGLRDSRRLGCSPRTRRLRVHVSTRFLKETTVVNNALRVAESQCGCLESAKSRKRIGGFLRRRVVLPHFWSAMTACVLLCGCGARQDTFKPHIVITVPDGGGASTSRNFLISGYVLTDRGVKSVSVQGVDLPVMKNAIKIQAFMFRTAISGKAAIYTIRAVDVSGNVSTLLLPVRVDTVKPSFQSVKVEHSGTKLRVTGVASDDQRVSQVLANGNRLAITPGLQVEFFVEAPGPWIDLKVIDAAGNSTQFRAQ